MRFLIGLLIGLALGFAGAILFAPAKARDSRKEWPPAGEANGATAALQRAVHGLRERVNEALTEARQAQDEAEKDMQARYEKVAGRPSGKPRP
ncbi:MAG: hypothetical protein Q7T33_09285 [Dehalococcoidia bacterium]|nr:hypothetical protein [Dehalococcoidia bacterium]